MKREGYIAISLAVVLSVVLYFVPRSPNGESEVAEKEVTAVQEPDSLEQMVMEAVEMLQSGTAPPMQAIGQLRKVVEIEPDHGSANFYLGYFSVMSGQFDKAVERMTTVLRVYPENTDAMLLMAQAKQGLGDMDAAKEYAQMCLEHEAIPETHAKAKELLNSLN